MEPSRSTRDPAARRDHVRHGDPQLADDDRARLRGRRVPRARARARRRWRSGARCSSETSDLAGVPADSIVSRDAEGVRGPGAATRSRSRRSRPSARALDDAPGGAAGGDGRGRASAAVTRIYALMVTDILAKDTDLYVSATRPAGERVRHRRRGRRDPAARRDEPEEAGRTKGACRALIWVACPHGPQKAEEPQAAVAELAVDYLKIKTATKAAKGGQEGRQGHRRLQGGQEDADREADPGHRRRRPWPRSSRRRSSRAAAATPART